MTEPTVQPTEGWAPIHVVIGTRAQLVKMAPLMALMQRESVPYRFIYTAQHRETLQRILDDFGVKAPDVTLRTPEAEANTLGRFAGWWGLMLLNLFRARRIFPNKGLVLTHGDTATCAWAAVAGKLAGCRVGHVESGLRSFNLLDPFPEELMRLITFRFSDVYFAPNPWAVDNLKKYRGDKVCMGMNTLYDAVRAAIESAVSVDAPEGPYAVASIHRFENIFHRRLETRVIPVLERVARSHRVIMVLHPSTREVLNRDDGRLYRRLADNPNIELKPRYPFFEFINLVNRAAFVITDGGSNQEELSYLGRPTLLLRDVTERVEGLDANVLISKFDEVAIDDFIRHLDRYERPPVTVDTRPCEVVVDWLKAHCGPA